MALTLKQRFCTSWNLASLWQQYQLLASTLRQSSIRTSSSTYG